MSCPNSINTNTNNYRDFRFYAEVVLAASLSVITANLWLRVIDGLVSNTVNHSNVVMIYIILAIIFTGISMIGLWVLFKDSASSPKDGEVYYDKSVNKEFIKPKIIGVG